MKLELLGEICEINPRKPSNLNEDMLCSFVPMEYVDDISGEITKKGIKTIAEVSTGYTFFQDNDVLFAKITPCMENGKGALVKGLLNGIGFGSTEFHVVRAKEQTIPQYLHYFLRYDKVREFAAINMTGSAGQQRVPASFLQELSIPLPSLDEQKRIAARLGKADRLRRLRRYALEVSEGYLQSLFLDMFGDPATNPMGWEREKVDDICNLVRGSSPRPQGDPLFFGGPVPRLMIADITRDGIFVTPIIDSLTHEGAKRSRPMKAGDVVMAVSGAVGLSAILRVDACIHDGFVGFAGLNPEIDRVYFVYLSNALGITNAKQAAGAIWKNLTTDQIKDWSIPIPPKHLQVRFHNIIETHERLRAQQREALRQAEHLFQTLLHQAFDTD